MGNTNQRLSEPIGEQKPGIMFANVFKQQNEEYIQARLAEYNKSLHSDFSNHFKSSIGKFLKGQMGRNPPFDHRFVDLVCISSYVVDDNTDKKLKKQSIIDILNELGWNAANITYNISTGYWNIDKMTYKETDQAD